MQYNNNEVINVDKQDYIEKYGTYFEAQGLPLSAGRVIGLLMVAEQPLTLDDIADQLEISKTSASTGTRLLESAAIIRRVTVRGERRIHYAIAANMWPEMFRQKIKTFSYLADLAQEGQSVVSAADTAVQDRLASMEEFYRFLAAEMEHAVDKWENRRGNDELF